jgi:hypothetical protein
MELDNLSQGHKSILIFDCEFWHVLNNGESVKNVHKKDFFFLPREIGGILLKKKKEWTISTFYVTLDSPNKNMSLPLSQFSSVSQSTANKLNKLETKLELPLGESFYSELEYDEQEIWKEALETYNSDPNIKEHHQSSSWINKFMKVYEKSLVIVKGSSDIESIQNLCSIKKYKYSLPAQLIDIANWNIESSRLCGSAKLEDSFNCIQSKLSPAIKKLASKLPIGKAHNPSSDAAMTLVIAMYILENKNT